MFLEKLSELLLVALHHEDYRVSLEHCLQVQQHLAMHRVGVGSGYQ